MKCAQTNDPSEKAFMIPTRLIWESAQWANAKVLYDAKNLSPADGLRFFDMVMIQIHRAILENAL